MINRGLMNINGYVCKFKLNICSKITKIRRKALINPCIMYDPANLYYFISMVVTFIILLYLKEIFKIIYLNIIQNIFN